MKWKLGVNGMIFLLFLIGYEPALTGNRIHEWLNLTFVAAMLAHLVMHYEWSAAVTRQQFRRVPPTVRFHYVLGLLLFVVFVMMILSGLMISRSVLAWAGYVAARRSVWRELHSGFADALVFLIALHIGTHREWIALACKRHLGIKNRHMAADLCGGRS